MSGLRCVYHLERKENPGEASECDFVCLRFDNAVDRVGIVAWAQALRNMGFTEKADQIQARLQEVVVLVQS